MNCYNGEKYLHEAIDSVYAQTYANWEIIFWDNASTDNSAKIAKSYDSKLQYFCGEHTIPLGDARNKAIKKSSGKYIGFLDCDDLWMPEKLMKQIPLLKNNKIGIVISNVIYFSTNRKEKRLYRLDSPPKGEVFKQLLENYFIAMPTVLIRRESLESLDHWFDPKFNMIEDFDLFLRLCYKWELDYADCVLSKYRIHDKSFTSINREGNIIELKTFLNKINKIIPQFEQKYKKQIYSLKRNICWLEAQILVSRSNYIEASNKIKMYSFDSMKWFLKFILITLPFTRKIFIRKLLNRI